MKRKTKKRTRKAKEKAVLAPNVHFLVTCIGPVFVTGLDDYVLRTDDRKARKRVEALATEDALWTRLWETGLKNVRLEF